MKTVNARLPLKLQETEFWPLMVLVAIALALQALETSKPMDLLSRKTVFGYLRMGFHGGEVCFVRLHCTPKELDRRIANSSRKKMGKLTGRSGLAELTSRFDLTSEATTFTGAGVNQNDL